MIDRTRGTKVKIAAIHLINLGRRLGITAIKIAPATGRKIMAER
jgi:hypothetical protein